MTNSTLLTVTVLGTGTSSGVPLPCCNCRVCTSNDPRDKRLRSSVLLTITDNAGNLPAHNILIDTSPDLRQQALTHNIDNIDAVIYTHTHADHIFGIDDLRGFNFQRSGHIPIYCDFLSASELERMFPYIFSPATPAEGAPPPELEMNIIDREQTFSCCGLKVTPIPLIHGKLPVLGYRIGGFAYLTDCSEIPETSYTLLQGLDVLIIDGLRDRAHNTHFTQKQAVQVINRLLPKQAWLTHMSHEIMHAEANIRVAAIAKVPTELAYDGLKFTLELHR
ncbi:MAG: MBL fold metallo-hydrolase [bacterium]|nr:MBL fold metallo-hydrolase [bacterium]